jgi:glycerate-2-kinase
MEIARAALAAVDPTVLVARAVKSEAGTELRRYESHAVCAVGKAATGMLAGFEAAHVAPMRQRIVATGPHPTPTPASCDTARRALRLAESVSERECLVLLISGGASAMLALPAQGISLEDKIATVKLMLGRGLPIEHMNAVRKHLSAVKGGWLAAHARTCCTLAVSDVIGPAEDDLSVIGSGPGVPDQSTYAEAVVALQQSELWETLPAAVKNHLMRGGRGEIAETPKPGDTRLGAASGFVIGSRRHAMAGAAGAAERLGYATVVIDEPTLGEARVAGPALVDRALQIARHRERCCVISSGETTVHVKGSGRGGRNQELALAALPMLAAKERSVMLVSVGTDGVDGPTDAAGALADEQSLSRADAAGLAPVDAVLDANDAYPFFDALGDLVRTGPTGTNVGDLQILLIA